MNEDFLDLLCALNDAEVRYLVVGAYAVGIHGHPRATKDLDVWVEANENNAGRLVAALHAFGAPLGDVTAADFGTQGTGFKMGIAPRRIDIITVIDGVSFENAWPRRLAVRVDEGLDAPFIGLDDLLANKRASGRTQDRADVEALERIASEQERRS